MLSKKIEFNFLNSFRKIKSRLPEGSDSESKRSVATDNVGLQIKAEGFVIGFFISLAFMALILSIALVAI